PRREPRSDGALRRHDQAARRLSGASPRGWYATGHALVECPAVAPAPLMPAEPFHAAGREGPAVRGFLHRAGASCRGGLVLAHGAGGDSTAPLLLALGTAFAHAGVSVPRVDPPYRQARPQGAPGPSRRAARPRG